MNQIDKKCIESNRSLLPFLSELTLLNSRDVSQYYFWRVQSKQMNMKNKGSKKKTTTCAQPLDPVHARHDGDPVIQCSAIDTSRITTAEDSVTACCTRCGKERRRRALPSEWKGRRRCGEGAAMPRLPWGIIAGVDGTTGFVKPGLTARHQDGGGSGWHLSSPEEWRALLPRVVHPGAGGDVHRCWWRGALPPSGGEEGRSLQLPSGWRIAEMLLLSSRGMGEGRVMEGAVLPLGKEQPREAGRDAAAGRLDQHDVAHLQLNIGERIN